MKVSLSTIKEIVVFTTHKTSVENLTKFNAISENPSLSWCNGILFSYLAYANEETFIKQIEGIEYYDTVTFAHSDKISESKWNGYTIEVKNMTGNSLYEPLTKSLLEIK